MGAACWNVGFGGNLMDQYMWMERKAAKGTGMYTSIHLSVTLQSEFLRLTSKATTLYMCSLCSIVALFRLRRCSIKS